MIRNSFSTRLKTAQACSLAKRNKAVKVTLPAFGKETPMSVAVCETHIDSDKDGDCFPYAENDTTALCENCRERAYDAQQERLMETGGEPSLIEQQRAAYKIKQG